VRRVRAVSLLSEKTAPFLESLLKHLEAETDLDFVFDRALSWTESEKQLDANDAELGFLCGLLCARKLRAGALAGSVVAAPVMADARYENRPIYFSDVLVHRDSPFQDFASLRGATFGFNDPGSFSGWEAMRWDLGVRGEREGFFGALRETGSHLHSLQALESRQIDVAAIDSTVWDLVRTERPEVGSVLRTVFVIGPSPIPPVFVSAQLAPDARTRLVRALLCADATEMGRRTLAAGGVRRFVAVTVEDYAPLLERAEQAQLVRAA
jgi:phosphonate transport system substrate-binding protein